MADKQIYELDASSADLTDAALVAGGVGTASAKKYTGLELRAKEKGEREAQDDVIEASCGLAADGSWAVPVWNYVTAAALTAQGEGDTQKAAIHLLDTELRAANTRATANDIREINYTLSNAECKALHTTPIEISSGGLDIVNYTVIEISSVSMFNNFGSVVFTCVGTIEINFYNVDVKGDTISIVPNTLIVSAANLIQKMDLESEYSMADGTSIKIEATDALTLGDGEITVVIKYTVSKITR